MEILKYIGYLVLSSFGLAVSIVVLWFTIGLCVCFYKIFLKKEKYKYDKNNCSHDDLRYTDSHPDKPFTCHDCGKLI